MDDKMTSALAILDRLNGCDEHKSSIKPDDVAEALATDERNHESYADTDGVALVRLKSGGYATFSEWGDSSGHG